jgi:hypothetical protein
MVHAKYAPMHPLVAEMGVLYVTWMIADMFALTDPELDDLFAAEGGGDISVCLVHQCL